MVNCCCAPGCSEKSVKGCGISFHSFPRDTEMKQKWVAALGRQNFIPSHHTKLCSKHFQQKDFKVNFGQLLLNKAAVPSIFKDQSKIPSSLKKLIEAPDLEPASSDSEKMADDIKPTIDPLLDEELNVVKNEPDVVKDELNFEENELVVVKDEPNVEKDEPNNSTDVVEEPMPSSSHTVPQSAEISVNVINKHKPKANKKSKAAKSRRLAASAKLRRLRRTFRRFSYLADFNQDDMKSSEKAMKMWYMAKSIIERQRKKIKRLRQRNHSLLRKTRALKDLTKKLKHAKRKRKKTH